MYSRKRIRHWLSTGEPLLRIYLWPFSCSDDLIATLADAARAEVLDEVRSLSPSLIVDRFGGSSSKTIIVPDSRSIDAPLLEEVSKWLPKGARLVLLVDRLDDWGHLDLSTVLPDQVNLCAEEMQQLFGDSHRAAVASELTEGWAGPASLLARSHQSPDSFEALLDGEESARLLDQQVLAGLSRDQLDALKHLAWAGPIDPEDWRQMVVDEPRRLAAFEQIFRRRAWLVQGSSGWRLPHVLRRHLLHKIRSSSSAESLGKLDRLKVRLEIAGKSSFQRIRAVPLERCDEPPAPVADQGSPRAEPGLPSFRLELFGQPRLMRRDEQGTEEQVAWRLKRSFRCMAYLALAPEHSRSRASMIEDLWRDEPPAAADRNFHPTLSDARRTLGSANAIKYVQGTYRLGGVLGLTVDTDELQGRWQEATRLLDPRAAADDSESVKAQALEHLLAAWGLYRGPLMEDLEDSWLQEPRERFRQLYLEILRRVAELSCDLGRTSLELDAYRSLLITEPFDEAAHVAVMNIYGRSGRRDLVRRQFVNLQDQLKELRVEPSREAVSAYNRWMG